MAIQSNTFGEIRIDFELGKTPEATLVKISLPQCKRGFILDAKSVVVGFNP